MPAGYAERDVSVISEYPLAAVLTVPTVVPGPWPAMLLLAGSGADTRDGDLAIERTSGSTVPPAPGTMRQFAHGLARRGIASLRWDRRGFGGSGGDPAESDYATDLVDAGACLEWARSEPALSGERIAVAGHSAGALNACRLCRGDPTIRGAGLLGALSSPIDDMLRWNVGRLAGRWRAFTGEQRAWLDREMPRTLVRSEGIERVLDAARRGEEAVMLEGHGVTVEVRTARLRQDLHTDYAAEMRAVNCPALILHGGNDLNVPVEDAWRSYSVLRGARNDDVEVAILPNLDHYFCPTAADPEERVWERITGEGLRRPMSLRALAVFCEWASRVLGDS